MPQANPANLPTRLAAGAFILNSGVTKWSADRETAEHLHGFASTAYPFLGSVDAAAFAKLLATGEMALGLALLIPKVSAGTAGVGLAGFAGGLLGLYARVPGLRDGVRPTEQGTPIAKDVWLLGIGLGLVLDQLRRRRRESR